MKRVGTLDISRDRWPAWALLLAGIWLSDASAQTFRQYQFVAHGASYGLEMRSVPVSAVGPNEVLVRIHAASLNRRDLSMLNANYGRASDIEGQVPLSDGAGEVVSVGANVHRFVPGDRVAGIFFERWLNGQRTADGLASARGGSPGGMLTEMLVSHEDALVAIPAHLSYEEAATLPCAAVTAWVSLFGQGSLQPDDFVLLEGTGGVSVFGLQFASAAGARAIITSSSDDKLARAHELGAFGSANYRRNADWQTEVRALTSDRGVDHVLEVGGQDTLSKALATLAFDGHVALIGGLSGFAQDVPVRTLMSLGARVSGIYVGSRADFEAMNTFIETHQIHPVIDRVFSFEEAPAAFEFMANGDFMGKIVIRIQ